MATANKKDADPNIATSGVATSGIPAPYVSWDPDDFGEPGSGLFNNLWATVLDKNFALWTYPSGEAKGKYQLVVETTYLADDRTLGANHDGVFTNQESCGKLLNHLPSHDGQTPAELTGFKDMAQLRQFVKQLSEGATQPDGSPLIPEGTEIKAGRLCWIGERAPESNKSMGINPDCKGAQDLRSIVTTMKDSSIALPGPEFKGDLHYFRGLRCYLVRMPHVTSQGLPGFKGSNRKDSRESEVLCVTLIDPASVANLGKHMGAALTADGGSKPNGVATAGSAPAAQTQAGAAANVASSTAGINADVQVYADKFAEIAMETITTDNGNGTADFTTVRSAVSKGLKGGEMAKAIGTVNKLRANAQWWVDNGLRLEGDSISLAE